MPADFCGAMPTAKELSAGPNVFSNTGSTKKGCITQPLSVVKTFFLRPLA